MENPSFPGYSGASNLSDFFDLSGILRFAIRNQRFWEYLENPPFQRNPGASTIPEILESGQISGNPDSTDLFPPETFPPRNFSPRNFPTISLSFSGKCFSRKCLSKTPGLNGVLEKHCPEKLKTSRGSLSGRNFCLQKVFLVAIPEA